MDIFLPWVIEKEKEKQKKEEQLILPLYEELSIPLIPIREEPKQEEKPEIVIIEVL